MKEQIQLMKIILDFLDHLSEEQMKLLIAKKVKLRLDMDKAVLDEPRTQICLDEVCEKIESFETREETIEYINSLSLLKVDLKEIAKKYNIPLGSKETNSQIIKKIVENVIGSKLRFNALLSTNLKS